MFSNDKGKKIVCGEVRVFSANLDCEQPLFFFRFSKGSVRACARNEGDTRETRAAAFSHARGHLCVSGVLLDGPRKKRDCS